MVTINAESRYDAKDTLTITENEEMQLQEAIKTLAHSSFSQQKKFQGQLHNSKPAQNLYPILNPALNSTTENLSLTSLLKFLPILAKGPITKLLLKFH